MELSDTAFLLLLTAGFMLAVAAAVFVIQIAGEWVWDRAKVAHSRYMEERERRKFEGPLVLNLGPGTDTWLHWKSQR